MAAPVIVAMASRERASDVLASVSSAAMPHGMAIDMRTVE